MERFTVVYYKKKFPDLECIINDIPNIKEISGFSLIVRMVESGSYKFSEITYS